MTVNKYFNVGGLNLDNTNEQTLIQDLTAESIQINGIDVLYLPRTMQKEDTLFGEDVLSAFNANFPIEMYIESVDSFDGEGDVLEKFGLSIKDEVNLLVSTPRFLEVVGFAKPKEGDLIYFPLSKGLFEIRFVEDEQPFFPLGTLPTFKLRCELFDYSSETFATGEPVLDDMPGDIDPQLGGIDPYDNSDDIETEGDSYVDFTESNPFGTF